MIYDISPVNNYDGNNTATTFDFDFYVESPDELKVYLISSNDTITLLTNEVDYTINELKNPEGSYITYPIEGSTHGILGDDEKLSLQMYLPMSQETQYNNSSLLNLSALEHSFDYLTRLIQIIARKIDLCVKTEEGTSVAPGELINNIISLGSSVLAQAQEFQETLEEAEDLKDDATTMYNAVLSTGEALEELQNTVTTMTTSKANANGDNFAASIKALDGQWVFPSNSITTINLDNTLNTAQMFDVSNFLPNDTYKYEVMFECEFNHQTNSGNYLYLLLTSFNNANTPIPIAFVNGNTQNQHNFCIVPVTSNRNIGFKVDSTGFTTGKIMLLAYRRIGTNI